MRLIPALLLLCVCHLAVADNLTPSPASTEVERIADLVARNQLDQAHEAALAWQEAQPQDARAAYWVGNTAGQLAMRSGMFKAMGYAKASRQALQKAVEIDASDVRAQFALMQFYSMAPGMMGGDADEAKAIAERIAKLSEVEGLRAKAQLLAADKDMDGWLRENKAVLALQPAHPDVLGSVVGYLLGKNDFDAAKTLLDAAKAADPDHPAVRYQFVKWAALSGRELDSALAEIDALIAMPRYPERFSLSGAQYRRAQVLAKLGRKDQAIAAYEASLAVDEDFEAAEEELEALRKG